MENFGTKHIVASGLQAVFPVPDSYSLTALEPYGQSYRQQGIGILTGFLKNYGTGLLYGLTAGTKIELGQSFCIDIPQGELYSLPSRFHPYKRGNLVEIGKCILKIDEMKSFRPGLDYSNCTNAALIEIHAELRRYFILDLRDAERNQQAVTVRDPVPGRHVYYQCDRYKTDCAISDVNDGVFSVKCYKAFDSIEDEHIGALIRSDDDDRHTSVFGLLFTTIDRCGWAAPMKTVLERLKEDIGFEVEFLQAPRKPLLTIRDPSAVPIIDHIDVLSSRGLSDQSLDRSKSLVSPLHTSPRSPLKKVVEKQDIDDVKKKLEATEGRLNSVGIPDTCTKGDCVMPYQTTNTDDINCDNTAIIKNMPDQKSDEYDVNALIFVGLHLCVPVKRIVRLNSHNCNPGEIQVEFFSHQDKINVLRVKDRLKYINKYSEIVLENHKSHTEMYY